jgi:hypothetical protein
MEKACCFIRQVDRLTSRATTPLALPVAHRAFHRPLFGWRPSPPGGAVDTCAPAGASIWRRARNVAFRVIHAPRFYEPLSGIALAPSHV